ncbi:MAG: hypothetical protein U0172_13925 [Nitrospiraceae bacterium]
MPTTQYVPLAPPTVDLTLLLRIIQIGLVCGTLLLTAAHALFVLWPQLKGEEIAGLLLQIDLGRENNIPTWFATSMLLLCAGLLGLVSAVAIRAAEPYRFHWLVLAAGFLLLSLDEAASLHEALGRHLEHRASTAMIAHDGSLLPMITVAGVVGISFVGFLWRLPNTIRWMMVVAGLLYVGGAVGMEMLEAQEEFITGSESTPKYFVMVLIEECLEMSGLTLFFHTLVRHLQDRWGTLIITSSATQHPPESEHTNKDGSYRKAAQFERRVFTSHIRTADGAAPTMPA